MQLRVLTALVAGWMGVHSVAQGVQTSQQPPPAPGTVVLNADTQQQVEKGHVVAQGYVDIQSDDIRLQADRVEYWNEEGRVVAEGNVVFQQGDQKIVGSRMEVDLDDGTGTFYDAHGVAGTDFYFYGDVVERESEDVYVIHSGAFTSCTQPVPRWRFTAGKARVKRDHHVLLHHTLFRVKSIPVFYAPIVYYPIDEDERSTGFLLPQIGSSNLKGQTFNVPFFWAINRSMDATFNVERFSKLGYGTGTEFRYVLSERSRGDFQTYFFNNNDGGEREYTLNYSMNQDLPAGFRANARVDFFSSFDFQQIFQESYNAATRRSKRASANITRNWSQYNLRVLFDRNETAFGQTIALRQVLPSVTLSSRPSRLAGTPLLFSFSSEASSLERSQGATDVQYQRFDVAPSVSYPFTKLPYLTFRTTLNGRYTHYTAQQETGSILDDEDIDRRYYEVSVDVRGPTFARIFNTPGNFYADRYKHVIEPQFVYSYRSRIDAFDQIPKFDSQDYVPGTNQLAFNLVNRFFGKRISEAQGNAAPVEFLTWTLSQRYFFDANASLYDRQFSTPFFTEQGTPSTYSPITSKLHFRPSRNLGASWNLDYDVNFKKFTAMSVAANYGGSGWGSVVGSWSRRAFTTSEVVRNNVRGAANVNLTRRIQTRLETSYDLTNDMLQHVRAGVTYGIQCCGFLVEYTRFNFGQFRDENLFRFGITLANIGSFGTMLGGVGRVNY